ncbi:hypothetical protein ACLBWP_03370 [Microbacterium sp. M1A1_1b]
MSLTQVETSRRGSRRYGPGFVRPDDTIESEYVFAGVELLDPGIRYGSAEPRVFTPPLRPLTPQTSWGYAAIDFATDVLEVNLFPWQRWFLIHLLELDQAEERLRFDRAVLLVARQQGKSLLSQVIALFFMVVRQWKMVLGTAQDLTTAEEVWDHAVATMQDDEYLAGLIENVSLRNGKKALELWGRIRYMVKASNRRAGRGLSCNLVMMDELREQTNWAAWGAVTKTTQAQDESLILCLSNAGDITSVVLRFLRLIAHEFIGDPDGIVAGDFAALAAPTELDREPDELDQDGEFDDGWDEDELEGDASGVFLAEWSAPPGADVMDRDGWAWANPSLGHMVRIKKIAKDAAGDPEWVFRTEVLCQWSDSILDGPFPAGAWEQGRNEPGEKQDGTKYVLDDDKIVGSLWACIDQSTDRSITYVAVAGIRPDGVDQFGLVAARNGTDWVKQYLQTGDDIAGRIVRVTGQTKGAPVSPLMRELTESYDDPADRFRIPVEPWQGSDLLDGTAELFDAVRDVTVRHNPQPPLDLAAATATMKTLGSGAFLIDRNNSQGDVAPLQAVCGALWLLRQRVVAAPPAPPEPAAVSLGSDFDPDDPDWGSGSLTSDLNDMGF